MGDVVFTTPRLTVRDFRETDLDDVNRMWSDPDAARFMDNAPKSSPESARWLEQVIHHNRVRPRVAYNLAITLSGVDRAIGWVGYGPSERDPDGKAFGAGYLLDPLYWSRGYMSEVLRGVADHVFGALGGASLSAWCYAENVASAKTLEKVGFTLVNEDACTDDGAQRCLTYKLYADSFKSGDRPGATT